ncbi:hypothetical protein EIP91_010261 [Steccherinum ochraceum]|uniref:Wiskott-Aldrich syndrome protein 1 n=1 Tax=Steccherinum ochraceum TaxID=92696 RepID=A0A4R0R0T0_9APHY|nr:hypothetical protein EIP91_010261 [Steccherinum ochraceum]
MPSPSSSSSSLSTDFKRSITSLLPANAKIIASASARVYHAPFGSQGESWTFSGLQGVLVFGRDRNQVHPDKQLGVGPGTSIEQNYWFRLLDVDNAKGLVWMHQIPYRLDYRLDKPFFHEFSGKTRQFGFRFDEDAEANKFYRKVISRIPNTTASSPKAKTATATPFSASKRLLSSMISRPAHGTFVHVGHVGVDRKGSIEVTEDIEPGWTMMLQELRGCGANDVVVRKDRDFIDGFWAGVKATSDPEQKIMPGTEQRSDKPRKTIKRKPIVNLMSA